jgi:chromosome segregation protein
MPNNSRSNLLEAGADEASLLPDLGRPGRLACKAKSPVWAAIAELGSVNLAALQELETAT